MSQSERAELLGLIASVDPSDLKDQVGFATTSRVRSIMEHYLPLAKEKEAEIWAKQRAMKKQDDPSIIVPDDERVEDAGLNYEEAPPATKTREKSDGDGMSTNIVPITLGKRRGRALRTTIVIGKDILELAQQLDVRGSDDDLPRVCAECRRLYR